MKITRKCRNWQMKYFLIMNLSWKRALRMFLKTVINLLKSCFPVSFLLKSWPTVDMNVASIKKLMCGKYKPNDQFLDIFNSTNDTRYALTFDSVLYEQFNSTNKTLILKKLWRTDGNCPMFYMRLAQMKLFQAESVGT